MNIFIAYCTILWIAAITKKHKRYKFLAKCT